MTDKAATWLFYKFDLYMSEQTLIASLTRKHGLGLAMVFVKILYAAVSFGCFILTAEMFSIGDFKTYGSEWIKKLNDGNDLATEEKDKLFPKMVACEVKRWGASGILLYLNHGLSYPCPIFPMSYLTHVLSYPCPILPMSYLTHVLSDPCPILPMSYLTHVLS